MSTSGAAATRRSTRSTRRTPAASSWPGTFTAGAENSITQATPLVIDGVMYVNAGGTLFALKRDLRRGDLDHEAVGKRSKRGAGPTYGDGSCTPSAGATLYAADATTGELVESFGNGGRLEIVSRGAAVQVSGRLSAERGRVLARLPDNHAGGIPRRHAVRRVRAVGEPYSGRPGGGGGRDDRGDQVGLQHRPAGAAGRRLGDAKDSWGDGQKVGGGVWTPPAIDTELGLLYVNTGNPSPDYDGSARPGMNLFTNATIALHLDTAASPGTTRRYIMTSGTSTM